MFALLAAALLAGAAAGPAGAAPDPQSGFGYNVQSLVRSQGGLTFDQSPPFFAQMVNDGIRVARTDALWWVDEPSAPSGGVHIYDWATDDRVAAGLAQQGIRWDAVLSGSPKWAASDSRNPYGAPLPGNYSDFAAYAAAFASRYGAGGSFWAEHPELPAFPVTTIEIWNEPNTKVHWGSQPDASAFARLFTQSQAAVKAADPTAQVLVGGIVWNDDVAYLQSLLGALGKDVPIDGLGYHPYAPTVTGLVSNVQRMRAALDAAGRSTVPLLLNELGWPAAYDRAAASHAVDGPVTDEARAATLSLTVDGLSRSTCGIGGLVIFDLVEGEQQPQFIESLMGLYRSTGATTVTGDAYSAAIARYRAAASAPGPPVPACGAQGEKATQLLSLSLSAAPAAGGCDAVHVSYRGEPLEEAQVLVSKPYRGAVSTDATGQSLICPPAPGGNAGLRVQATVAGVAKSNFVVCNGACHAVGAAATCATAHVAFPGGRALRAVLRRGLLVHTAGCVPQQGDAVTLRATVMMASAAAHRLGLARAKGHAVTVGTARGRLAPGAKTTLRAKLNSRARRALRHARTVPLAIRVAATEAGTRNTVLRKLRLRG